MQAMLALIIISLLDLASGATQHGLKLEKIILFSRHGIRTPYGASDMKQKSMEVFSRRPDARWGDNITSGEANLTLWGAKASGALTDHGAVVVNRMGQFYASEYKAIGGDAKSITVYADHGASNRDVETAKAFMSGMLPNEAVTIQSSAKLTTWLFNQGYTTTSDCQLPSETIVDGTLGGDYEKFATADEQLVMAVNDALQCCQPSACGHANCTLMDMPSEWNPAAFWSLYFGPLSVASNLGEWIQLMYLNNLDYQGLLGPGYDAKKISDLMRAHRINMDITDDSLWTARSFASDLLAHILATMEQLFSEGSKTPVPSGDGLYSKATDKMVYYAGHDVNIYFIRALLDLQWVTESFVPNQSPPGGMLRFELLLDDDNKRYIKAYFETQSFSQQRSASVLNENNAPDRSFIAIPRCAFGPDGSCPFETFKDLVQVAIKPKCVFTTKNLRLASFAPTAQG